MSKEAPLMTLRAAGRDDVGLTFVPLFVLLPALLFVLYQFPAIVGDEAFVVPWYWWLGVVVLCVLFPLYAVVRNRLTTRYTIHARSISAERGLFSRVSSEIRIIDIRNITIRQSLIDRLVQTGDIAFSSSAGDGEEVVFQSVSKPHAVKEFVKDLQERLRPGQLPSDDGDTGLPLLQPGASATDPSIQP